MVREAGGVHGVVEGTLFAIHACSNACPSTRRLACSKRTARFSTFVCVASAEGRCGVPNSSGARASVWDWRHRESVLKVFIQTVSNAASRYGSIHERILAGQFSSQCRSCAFVARAMPHCNSRDWIHHLEYAPVLNNIQLMSSLPDMLRGISFFNFHLSRDNSESR